MATSYQDKLRCIEKDPAFLAALATQFRGIERESLRVDERQQLSQSPHPQALGSALCHPQITTDFSEAQLEFITQVHPRIDTCLYDLHKLHQFTCQQLDTENQTLWAGSMPTELPEAAAIPLAQFGSSNVAQMKTAYRQGLSNRYNSEMQTISGIHYNFSMSDKFFVHYQKYLGNHQPHDQFKTDQYFNLMRNFHRVAPLHVYLFGASPAFDKSFLPSDHKLHANLHQINNTLYLPNATSLRMSDIGYTSEAQRSLYICFNTLENYTQSLRMAIKENYPEYEAIGLTDEDGHYKQLNTSLLQIENEFYGVIRPKRVCASGEAPINALNRAGIEYVEIRCVDIDPFKPMGIDEETLIFLDLLLLYCLLEDSPDFTSDTCNKAQDNLTRVIHEGRNEDLVLHDLSNPSQTTSFNNWGESLLNTLTPIAELLDKLQAETPYQDVLRKQQDKIQNSALTPSAKILDALKEYGDHTQLMKRKNQDWQDYFLKKPLSDASLDAFKAAAANSLAQQRTLEQTDTLPFADYLVNYYKQY